MECIDSFHHLVGREGGNITWWQMTVRGVLVFFYGLVLVRLAGQRIFGKLAAFDIVLAVLIGSNLSRTLTANAPFVPTLAATGGIVALHWAITKLALRSKMIGWLVKGDVLQLVQDGRVDWQAMRRGGISEGDLEEAMRDAGVRGVNEVDSAFMERSGNISVLRAGRLPSSRRDGDCSGHSAHLPAEGLGEGPAWLTLPLVPYPIEPAVRDPEQGWACSGFHSLDLIQRKPLLGQGLRSS
jgi:uncharacterized membrane protein YcaP (DUF421 family)